MTVQTWREVGNDGGGIGEENEVSLVRNFIATTNRAADDAVTIMTYRRCPKRYDRHPNAPAAYAVRIEPTRRTGTLRIWDVVVSYSNKVDKQEDDDPLKRPAVIRWRSYHYTEPSVRDVDGNPILNTAYDPPVPPLEINKGGWIISVEKNVAKVPGWFLEYDGNPINSDAVTVQTVTFQPLTLRLEEIDLTEPKIENDVEFMTLTFSLHLKRNGWKEPFLNRGYNELYTRPINAVEEYEGVRSTRPDGLIVDKRPIYLGNERPTEPQWLDRDGHFIHPRVFKNSKVVRLFPKLHEERPFKLLPLK